MKQNGACRDRFYLRRSSRCGGSRKLVAGPHSNPHDAEANATLTTVYHSILSATLLSWPAKKSLSVDTVIAFVQSVADGLPSSSASSEKSPNVLAFGDILVDIIWAIDSELEEIVGDAKTAASTAEQGTMSPATVDQVVKAKGNAETDKTTVESIVRRLLVSISLPFTGLVAPLTRAAGYWGHRP